MRFEISYPDHREEISSDRNIVAFGRDPTCDVVIQSPRCSRKHAAVRVVPDGFHLVDMGSSNGVYVLGQKIDDAIIREGAVFSMGDVLVRILPKDAPIAPIPVTSDATLLQASAAADPPRRPLPPPRPRVEPRPRARPARSSPFAPLILGVSSIAVGVTLMVSALGLSRQIGALAYVLPFLGFISAFGGLALLLGFSWARNIHYAVFTIWTLTCLLAPLGIIGFAYHFRGEEQPETDTFFAVVIGIAAALALIALVAAAFLARIYVPARLPI